MKNNHYYKYYSLLLLTHSVTERALNLYSNGFFIFRYFHDQIQRVFIADLEFDQIVA